MNNFVTNWMRHLTRQSGQAETDCMKLASDLQAAIQVIIERIMTITLVSNNHLASRVYYDQTDFENIVSLILLYVDDFNSRTIPTHCETIDVNVLTSEIANLTNYT
jgi:hypothetical protein